MYYTIHDHKKISNVFNDSYLGVSLSSQFAVGCFLFCWDNNPLDLVPACPGNDRWRQWVYCIVSEMMQHPRNSKHRLYATECFTIAPSLYVRTFGN